MILVKNDDFGKNDNFSSYMGVNKIDRILL